MRANSKSFNRSLIIFLVLMLLLIFLNSLSRRVESKRAPVVDEETVTLSPTQLKTAAHSFQWYHKELPYCGPPFHIFTPPEDAAGSVIAGYQHYYDPGKKVFGCPDGALVTRRGAVWFDLSAIASKAPPLHVFVKNAVLSFKKDQSCEGEELLIGQENWLKDYPEDKLMAGDPYKKLPASPTEDVAMDVTTVVNNWVKGEDHGGYANFGFVFKQPREADLTWTDNDTCLVRYSDLSLKVTYTFDRPTLTAVPARPDLTVNPAVLEIARKNVALAANGGVATARSYTPDSAHPGYHFQPAYAIDGSRHSTARGSDFWRDESGLSSWLQVDFGATRTINEIDVITLQFPGYDKAIDPTETQTFTLQGATAYDVQYWNGSSWAIVPGGNITSNNLVWRKITFTTIKTTKIRLVVNASSDGVARIVELEAWGR